MADLEKTIQGLEICKQDGKLCFTETECPYQKVFPKCCQALMADALSLLGTQGPRVMTLTEAFDAEVAWLERYANPDDGVEPIIQPVIIRYYENGYWQCFIEQDESADLSLFLDGFGTEFRFWTSRPTDEQRRVTPW